MLIQVRLRGCGGVRSRRRHPQRKSPLVNLVVVERDPASISRPSFGIRGIDRRCGHFRVEKVRTNIHAVFVVPNPLASDIIRPANSPSLLFCVSKLLHLFVTVTNLEIKQAQYSHICISNLCSQVRPLWVVCRVASVLTLLLTLLQGGYEYRMWRMNREHRIKSRNPVLAYVVTLFSHFNRTVTRRVIHHVFLPKKVFFYKNGGFLFAQRFELAIFHAQATIRARKRISKQFSAISTSIDTVHLHIRALFWLWYCREIRTGWSDALCSHQKVK